MLAAIKKGVSFGLASGIITTLGLLVGLQAGSGSRTVVLAGIATIALADALSDALGMHLAEESTSGENKGVWQVMGSTFLAKLVFALTFIIPTITLPLQQAVIASIIWGALLIIALSLWIARDQHERPWQVVAEHLVIATVVVACSWLIGSFISSIVV